MEVSHILLLALGFSGKVPELKYLKTRRKFETRKFIRKLFDCNKLVNGKVYKALLY